MRIKHLPEDERPVEKSFSMGIESLSNGELLALLINSGTKGKSAMALAEEVLAKDEKGISYLRESSLEELLSINGIGKAKAARIMAAVELGKRIASKPTEKRVKIESDEDVAHIFMEDLRYKKKEIFKAVLLDSKGGIISIETVSIGELTSTLVHPREVFNQAVKKSAAAMVFVHNHPSGDPTPSKEDFNTTDRLVACGDILGIKVVDHIVIGDGRYISIRSMGKI
ncbi:MAG: DNA repair protein RadC [Firmicutes bacterium]|jgi:DNA repair protein RadC|nr:DNA repair protein RadC [Bacillota bacterium]